MCLQDEEWQERTREAIQSIEVGHNARMTQQALDAAQHELAELATYRRPTGRDDSVLGSWFFIEKFAISDIHSNVTINLSSNIMATAQLLNAQVRIPRADVAAEPEENCAPNRRARYSTACTWRCTPRAATTFWSLVSPL